MTTYVFDFDGTLVDSMPVFVQAMVTMFEESGLAMPDDFVKKITPLGYKGTAAYAASCGFTGSIDGFVQRASALTIPAYHHTIPLKDGVREALCALHERGDRLNILTASPHSVLDVCLKRLGVYDWFEYVWSCVDFSLTKADVPLYHAVANALGVPIGACVFIDDNIGSITTAKRAGMTAVGVFDASSEDLVAEMKAAADRYIYSLTELL